MCLWCMAEPTVLKVLVNNHLYSTIYLLTYPYFCVVAFSFLGPVSERRFNRLRIKNLTQNQQTELRNSWVFGFRTGVQGWFNQLYDDPELPPPQKAIISGTLKPQFTMATASKWRRSSYSSLVMWLSTETWNGRSSRGKSVDVEEITKYMNV